MKIISALIFFIFSASTYSQALTKPVQIIGIGIHYGGYVIYSYQVKNNGTQNISRVVLGNTGEADSSFAGFDALPDDSSVDLPMVGQWFPRTIISSPDGWGAKLITEADEGDAIGIDWVEGTFAKALWPRRLQEINAPQVYPGGKAIAPGQISNEFSVKVDRPDYAYVHGYASVNYGDHTISIPVDKGGTTPPALSVTLTPAMIWSPDDKLVPINANISVKDDHDPQPAIRLESVTSSETLVAGDIQGATAGADVRKFQLKATRGGNNLAGRIYTVTYSATDGSGNKSITSATVTVPHDQGKK